MKEKAPGVKVAPSCWFKELLIDTVGISNSLGISFQIAAQRPAFFNTNAKGRKEREGQVPFDVLQVLCALLRSAGCKLLTAP